MIDDNTLTLYFYQDGLSDKQRQQVAQELSQNRDSVHRYQKLCDELQSIHVPSSDSAPADAIARWRHALDETINNDTVKQPWWARLMPVIWVSATAVVLAIGIGIGTQLNRVYLPQGPPDQITAQIDTSQTTQVAKPGPPSALTRGLTDYLQKTQVRLVSLSTTSVEQRGILILEMIEQNRLFQRIAEQNGAADIARFLRALEPVLIAMANPQAAPNIIDSGIDQLDFELGATLTKLNRRASNQTHDL